MKINVRSVKSANILCSDGDPATNDSNPPRQCDEYRDTGVTHPMNGTTFRITEPNGFRATMSGSTKGGSLPGDRP